MSTDRGELPSCGLGYNITYMYLNTEYIPVSGNCKLLRIETEEGIKIPDFFELTAQLPEASD